MIRRRITSQLPTYQWKTSAIAVSKDSTSAQEGPDSSQDKFHSRNLTSPSIWWCLQCAAWWIIFLPLAPTANLIPSCMANSPCLIIPSKMKNVAQTANLRSRANAHLACPTWCTTLRCTSGATCPNSAERWISTIRWCRESARWMPTICLTLGRCQLRCPCSLTHKHTCSKHQMENHTEMIIMFTTPITWRAS